MMQLEIAGERHPIVAGETIIGSAPDAALVLDGEAIRPRHAILHGSSSGAAIRTAEEGAEVLVNGVPVGADPTPVLHGDKIRIGDHELLAVDPGRGGSTQLFDSGAFADLLPHRAARAAATAGPSINGRVVCLTDGREYKVKDGLVFGRDAGSDVVVTGTEVSRVHAEICPQSDGYVLTDSSANGTFVNGTRITDPRPLARADVIRIGSDEFRFYADPRHVAEPQTAAAPGETTEATPDEGPAEPPPGASHRLFDTLHAMPVTDLTSAALSTRTAPLASLLIRSGSLKGNRIPVSLAAANIGRGDDNDVIIADPSVSATHARLERRETIWNLADRGSTNGTFVDGELVTEETPLGPGSTLRFGDVSVLFEPLDEEDERPGAVEGSVADEPANVRPRSIRAPRAQVPAAGGVPNWLIVLVLAVLAAIAFLLLT